MTLYPLSGLTSHNADWQALANSCRKAGVPLVINVCNNNYNSTNISGGGNNIVAAYGSHVYRGPSPSSSQPSAPDNSSPKSWKEYFVTKSFIFIYSVAVGEALKKFTSTSISHKDIVLLSASKTLLPYSQLKALLSNPQPAAQKVSKFAGEIYHQRLHPLGNKVIQLAERNKTYLLVLIVLSISGKMFISYCNQEKDKNYKYPLPQ